MFAGNVLSETIGFLAERLGCFVSYWVLRQVNYVDSYFWSAFGWTECPERSARQKALLA
jgi:hypothetical protein